VAQPSRYRDTQLVDTAHLIALLMERCDQVGMSYHSHKMMAQRHHPNGGFMLPIHDRHKRRSDVTFGWTAVMWIKVFGWSFVIQLEGREYPIGSTDDFRNVIIEYLNRHDMNIYQLEKQVLKTSGGPSISRLHYGTIKHIQLNTAIRAVEGLGGHVMLRRPLKR
jgi:hypothetical protein